eukprot:TRINITY_DN11700_c0_g2_i1.p1 TRINITY_DN11700_c0_g2~~TRINITY_DN11700_c0_g2_i1.p1  ORF type:complete len:771 (+),score=175.89 TRINITY_DN11700_c0_g2_i1:84-2315(+)
MALALAPDNELLASSSRSLMIRVWKWQDQECSRAFKAHTGPVLAMDFDSTSTLLATGSADSTIKVWDVIRGYCTHNFKGSQGIVELVRFDAKELELYSAANDGHLRCWNLNTSKQARIYKGHMSAVRGLVIDRDSNTIVTAGRDRVIMVWRMDTAKSTKTIPTYELMEGLIKLPSSLAARYGAQGPAVVTAGESGQLKVWDIHTGDCLLEQDPGQYHAFHVKQLINTPSGSGVATLSFDHQIQTFAADDLSRSRLVIGHYDDVLDVQFATPDRTHVVVANNSSVVHAVAVDTFDARPLIGHTDIVLTVAVSRDGRFIVTGSKDNSVRVWMFDAASPNVFRCVAVCSGHANAVSTVAFSQKQTSYVVSSGVDTTLKLWNLSPLETADSTDPVALKATFTVRAHEKDVNSVAVAPNDKIIATGSQDKTIKIWDAAAGELKATLKGHRRGVWCVIFSPTDQVLASASGDTTVRVWALADGSCLRTFEGHTNSVLKVGFVSKGMQLVSSGSDGLVKLWTIKTAEEAATIDAHEDKVWALSSNDVFGGLLATGGSDGTVAIWKDSTQEQAAAAHEASELEIQQGQELDNLMREEQYAAAFKLALKLKRPRTMLSLVRNLLDLQQQDTLSAILADSSRDELGTLMGFVTEWNTNNRASQQAQHLLQLLLKTIDMKTLATLPDMSRIVDSLIPYTQRHYQRADRLLQQASLVDYMWQTVRVSEDAASSAKRASSSNSKAKNSKRSKKSRA